MDADGVLIRRLGQADQALARHAVETLKLGSKLPEPDFLSGLLSRQDSLLLVATEQAQPIGFLIAYALPRIDRPAPMMLLYEIEVAESHQRLGIGRRLVQGFLDWCQQEKAAMAWCLTERENSAARQLYASLGGEESDIGEVMLYEWMPAS